MCGIVGYVGKKEVVPIIIEGLRRLEYRGYDSAGIAVAGNGDKSADSPRRRQAAQSGRSHPPQAARRHLRHRPHSLGHSRTSHRRKRSSSSRLHRQDRGRAQRHCRELSQPEEKADRRRPQVHHRNRYRSHRAPDREASFQDRQRSSSHARRSGSQDREGTERRLRSGRDFRRRTQQDRGRAQRPSVW